MNTTSSLLLAHRTLVARVATPQASAQTVTVASAPATLSALPTAHEKSWIDRHDYIVAQVFPLVDSDEVSWRLPTSPNFDKCLQMSKTPGREGAVDAYRPNCSAGQDALDIVVKAVLCEVRDGHTGFDSQDHQAAYIALRSPEMKYRIARKAGFETQEEYDMALADVNRHSKALFQVTIRCGHGYTPLAAAAIRAAAYWRLCNGKLLVVAPSASRKRSHEGGADAEEPARKQRKLAIKLATSVAHAACKLPGATRVLSSASDCCIGSSRHLQGCSEKLTSASETINRLLAHE